MGLLLAIILAACSSAGQGSPTSTAGTLPSNAPFNPSGEVSSASPTPVPQLPVKVISQALVPDLWGNLHVVGEVRNESGQPASGIILTLVARDAGGVSVLKTDTGEILPEILFLPLVSGLADGQAAPFDFALPAGVTAPPFLQVFVSAFTPVAAELLPLQVEHTQVMTGQEGQVVLVGELVNQNTVAVRVSSVAGLMRDSANAPVSAASASAMPGLLQPAGDALNQDRAPFKIPFHTAMPVEGTWQVVTSAARTDSVDTSVFAIDQAVNLYADSRGILHMVSNLKNNAERTFSVQIMAGMYSATGTVLDTSKAALPVDLAPGEELPFDIGGFSLLDGRTDQQAKLDQYTLQVDAGATVSSGLTWIKLETEGDQAVDEGQGVWKFSGSVTNTSSADLRKMVVIAILKDNSTGALMAVSSADLTNPAGTVAPGVHMEYSIEVWADPTNTNALKSEVLVFGAGG